MSSVFRFIVRVMVIPAMMGVGVVLLFWMGAAACTKQQEQSAVSFVDTAAKVACFLANQEMTELERQVFCQILPEELPVVKEQVAIQQKRAVVRRALKRAAEDGGM